VVSAIAGTDPAMWHVHVGFFAPDSPMASDVGMDAIKDPPDLDRARAMLAASGYAGETVAMTTVGTIATLNATAQVVADAWKRVGFNVDFRSVEIAAALQVLGNQGPVSQGGWSAASEGFSGAVAADPVLLNEMNAVGRAGTFGWPDVAELASLRKQFMTAPDIASRQAICRRMQAVCFDQVPFLPCGVVYQTTAYSKTLTGMLRGLPLFYGIRRS
jgi:peptide/nickel transport system substrate-binding protein